MFEYKEKLKQRGVKYCFVNYVNIHGACMGKVVPVEHVESLVDGSLLFVGVPSDGLNQEPHHPEVAAIADLRSLTIMPWKPEVAWVASNLHQRGEPYPYCSRVILTRVVERARRDFGLCLNLGIEAEMYLVTRTSDGAIIPLCTREPRIPAYNIQGTLNLFDFLDRMTKYMNELGWDVSYFVHEGGRSQVEFCFAHADPITTADRYTFLRIMAKEVAREMGAIATFMPKPFTDDLGNGAHFNISFLGSNDQDIFTDDRDPLGLSSNAYHFIGGILKHGKSSAVITCPTVNSYKRVVARGFMPSISWAPVYICYGGDNRTTMLRVATRDRRIEYRTVDSSCNAYLAAAFILAAGLEGIEHEIEPGEPRADNMYELSDSELARQGVALLPRTLLEAIECFEQDCLPQVILGDKLKSDFIKIKKEEWTEYYYRVSDWEREIYLEW